MRPRAAGARALVSVSRWFSSSGARGSCGTRGTVVVVAAPSAGSAAPAARASDDPCVRPALALRDWRPRRERREPRPLASSSASLSSSCRRPTTARRSPPCAAASSAALRAAPPARSFLCAGGGGDVSERVARPTTARALLTFDHRPRQSGAPLWSSKVVGIGARPTGADDAIRGRGDTLAEPGQRAAPAGRHAPRAAGARRFRHRA